MKNTQELVITKLEKLGFKVTHSFATFPELEEESICLTKKTKGTSFHALVEHNGEVNGQTLEQYLQNIK
jgi:hypothetical protein